MNSQLKLIIFHKKLDNDETFYYKFTSVLTTTHIVFSEQ